MTDIGYYIALSLAKNYYQRRYANGPHIVSVAGPEAVTRYCRWRNAWIDQCLQVARRYKPCEPDPEHFTRYSE